MQKENSLGLKSSHLSLSKMMSSRAMSANAPEPRCATNSMLILPVGKFTQPDFHETSLSGLSNHTIVWGMEVKEQIWLKIIAQWWWCQYFRYSEWSMIGKLMIWKRRSFLNNNTYILSQVNHNFWKFNLNYACHLD